MAQDRGDSGSPPRTATVDKDAGVPLHRQLFLVLHDEIERGSLEPGAPLPSEQALCEQFGVSRITVRRALADLVDDELIERKHGVGSFVLDPPARRRRDTVGSYLDGLRQVDFETDVEVLEFGVRVAPRAVADRLAVDAKLLYAQRLRHERRTNEPLMVTEAWLPAELGGVVTETALAHEPLYELLTSAGVVLERFDHELTAEIAGPRTALLLATSIGAPLIRVDRVAYSDGAPHHVMSILMSPSRSRILLRQSAEIADSGSGMAIAHDVRRRR